jgi:hypothetical protein
MQRHFRGRKLQQSHRVLLFVEVCTGQRGNITMVSRIFHSETGILPCVHETLDSEGFSDLKLTKTLEQYGVRHIYELGHRITPPYLFVPNPSHQLKARSVQK